VGINHYPLILGEQVAVLPTQTTTIITTTTMAMAMEATTTTTTTTTTIADVVAHSLSQFSLADPD
jgi:hypothetical protein